MKLLNPLQLLFIVIYLLGFISCTQEKGELYTKSDIKIIPKPQTIGIEKGSFQFTKDTKFFVTDKNQEMASQILKDKFKTVANWDFKITKEQPTENYILLQTATDLAEEEYEIVVDEERILVKANDYNGFVFAMQSIRQLLPEEIESKGNVASIDWRIPKVVIKDSPRFKWRGLMLDVSRHFFDKEHIKNVIDGLSFHKMNKLHLHLIDDQGWRIEIKKYPKLTEIGGWRVDQEDLHWNNRKANKPEDKATYGGFYTQEDLKEIVAYAQKMGIEIIPEIEMPAHVSSAVAAYPNLSCNEVKIGVPSGGVWPITDIYCAGKESTFEFLEDVINEVVEIFPSKYIHIGGDEATKTNWETCKHCLKRRQTEGLHDVEELQSYFVKRMQKFINAKGKQLIGWDEILEGGLAPDAIVMSWRGVKGGVEAATKGHQVIMSPTSHCYFDYYQGDYNNEPLAWGGYLPISKVYEFDPVVASMTTQEASYVLGGQANLWTEYIPTNQQCEYMIFPRVAAMSEALWTPQKDKSWDSFANRMHSLLDRYNYLGINYAKSAYSIAFKKRADIENKSIEVSLQNEFPNADIRFTLDGNDITKNPVTYNSPFTVSKTTPIQAVLFRDNTPHGVVYHDTIQFHKAVGSEVTYNIPFNENYTGTGMYGLVNAIRGTKDFHDGQWQGWYDKNVEVVIDLENEQAVKQVTVGSIVSQGAQIYYPKQIKVSLSKDGNTYNEVGSNQPLFEDISTVELKEFTITFPEQKARFAKVEVSSLEKSPKVKKGAWVFVDEILIE